MNQGIENCCFLKWEEGGERKKNVIRGYLGIKIGIGTLYIVTLGCWVTNGFS